MKKVKVFPNNSQNNYCLQASVQSILDFYFPDTIFTETEINNKTGYQPDSFSWVPATVTWLDQLGLNVKLYSTFDYQQFAFNGLDYMQQFRSKVAYDREKERGDYKYIQEIQRAAQQMVNSNLWIDKLLTPSELEDLITDRYTLALGKTCYEWLEGKYINGTPHFVVVVKKYSPGTWLIQDPGLPLKLDRKINQFINNHSIFGDLIIVSGIRK